MPPPAFAEALPPASAAEPPPCWGPMMSSGPPLQGGALTMPPPMMMQPGATARNPGPGPGGQQHVPPDLAAPPPGPDSGVSGVSHAPAAADLTGADLTGA